MICLCDHRSTCGEPHTESERQARDVPRLVAMFDALADSPVRGNVQISDYDGSVTKTLRMWAASRYATPVTRQTIEVASKRWDVIAVQVTDDIVIECHDYTTTRDAAVRTEAA